MFNRRRGVPGALSHPKRRQDPRGPGDLPADLPGCVDRRRGHQSPFDVTYRACEIDHPQAQTGGAGQSVEFGPPGEGPMWGDIVPASVTRDVGAGIAVGGHVGTSDLFPFFPPVPTVPSGGKAEIRRPFDKSASIMAFLKEGGLRVPTCRSRTGTGEQPPGIPLSLVFREHKI